MKRRLSLIALLFLAATAALPAAPKPAIDAYIHRAWQTLQRSVTDPRSYPDTKVGGRAILYLPHGFPAPPAVRALQQHGVDVAFLPRAIHKLGDVRPAELPRKGLLYLPHPYVVPGGMFNEMYGWDSYFIIRGLLRDHEYRLARGMVDNWMFEIDHYGAILNANRSYYLTRSQPPFLAPGIRAVYAAHPDRAWLARAYGYAARDHRFWTAAPNLAGATGLSRYFDVGAGPVPEMGADSNYYENVAAYALTHADAAGYVGLGAAKGLPVYSLDVHSGSARSDPVALHLTADYFRGDRAMRASGFDVSFRFGPFSGATHHYAPVGLNSLLYREERDLAWMARTLGRPADAARWDADARQRDARMQRLMWDPARGMFFDYDATRRRRSAYRYATTFYPLWAGLATPAEARAVERSLHWFEQPHGLAMSTVATGAQWDLPFGWAPVHLIAVEGLLRYGDRADALRLARKFNDDVRRDYARTGAIHEKYDVARGTWQAPISVGYKQNVVGFGWTNGTFRVFEHLLKR